MSRENSIKISYGMLISCIVIVLHHSVGDIYWGGVGNAGRWFFRLLHTGFFSFSMPFFFFWSGYFSERKAKLNYGEFIKGKMYSLAIPYLLWNLMWTIFAITLFVFGIKDNVFSWDGTVKSIFQGLFMFKYNGQYWYMLEIMILSVLVKLIDLIVNNRTWFIITVLAFFAVMMVFGIGIEWFKVDGLIAYLCGSYFCAHKSEKKKKSVKFWLFAFIVIIVGITCLSDIIPQFATSVLNYISFVAFWNVLDLFRNFKVYPWMENYFFVYSIHETPQLIIDKLISIILPLHGFIAAIITTLVGALLTICGANLLAASLERNVPSIMGLLNGRRKRINS